MKYDIYDGLVEQCKAKGITPTAAVVACGVDRTAVTRWSKGGGATEMAAQKIADYFGCTVEDLVNPQKEKAPTISDEDLATIEKLKRLPESDRRYIQGMIDAYLSRH